tara:strand:- start:802 stop:1125 length:324 start_codon:yes stop_codon:yes gene_type:complete
MARRKKARTSSQTELLPKPIHKNESPNMSDLKVPYEELLVYEKNESTKMNGCKLEELPKMTSKVVITEQRRKLKDLSSFELGLLPFLYLEYVVQSAFNFINSKYPLS